MPAIGVLRLGLKSSLRMTHICCCVLVQDDRRLLLRPRSGRQTFVAASSVGMTHIFSLPVARDNRLDFSPRAVGCFLRYPSVETLSPDSASPEHDLASYSQSTTTGGEALAAGVFGPAPKGSARWAALAARRSCPVVAL